MYEARKKRGLSMPVFEENKPELLDHQVLVWEGFIELDQGRQIGMDANPIPLSEIVSWLDLNQISGVDERIEVSRLIRSMDQVYLQHLRDASDEEDKKDEKDKTKPTVAKKAPRGKRSRKVAKRK